MNAVPSTDAPAAPASDLTAWTATLDELAELVARQRELLAGGAEVDARTLDALRFDPPGNLPPLPAELEERARQLLSETNELMALAGAVDAPSTTARAHRPAPRSTTSRVDLRA